MGCVLGGIQVMYDSLVGWPRSRAGPRVIVDRGVQDLASRVSLSLCGRDRSDWPSGGRHSSDPHLIRLARDKPQCKVGGWRLSGSGARSAPAHASFSLIECVFVHIKVMSCMESGSRCAGLQTIRCTAHQVPISYLDIISFVWQDLAYRHLAVG